MKQASTETTTESSPDLQRQEREEDAAWIRAIRQGDQEAYAHLVRRYSPPLHACLRRFFRDGHDVDDVLQDALVRGFRQLDRYDASRPFYPWLRKIAVNLALNELEKRKRRATVDDPELALAQLESDSVTDRRLEDEQLQQTVMIAVDELPPGWAAVFRLRTFEDMSYAEIASTLDVPVGTVMSRLARARTRLAQALADRFGRRRS